MPLGATADGDQRALGASHSQTLARFLGERQLERSCPFGQLSARQNATSEPLN